MKHLLIAAALVLTAGVSHAQTASTYELPLTAGHAQISGAAQWANLGGDDSSLIVAPKAEYFIMNNLSVGAGLQLYFAKYQFEGDSKFKLRLTSILPSATYYFWQAAGMATYLNQQIGLNLPDGGTGYVSGQTGLGIAFFLNQHVSIAPELQASYAKNQKGSLNLLVQIGTYL